MMTSFSWHDVHMKNPPRAMISVGWTLNVDGVKLYIGLMKNSSTPLEATPSLASAVIVAAK